MEASASLKRKMRHELPLCNQRRFDGKVANGFHSTDIAATVRKAPNRLRALAKLMSAMLNMAQLPQHRFNMNV